MYPTVPRRRVIQSLMGGGLMLPGIVHSLMAGEANAVPLASVSVANPLAAKESHFSAKAKRVIFLFLTGGYSHIDTFDPKSKEKGRDGFSRDDQLMGSIWPYRPDRTTGIEITDLFPKFRKCLKDVTLIRSMKSAHFDHREATLGMHTCSAQFTRPCFGSWVSYGLGTVNQDLPSFIVLAPKLPYSGTQVYANDFLPAVHQGTRLVDGEEPIPNLAPRAGQPEVQRAEVNLTQRLNQMHLEGRRTDSNLSARMRSFETAFQMQTSAVEALDVERESASTLEMYGLNEKTTKEFGWQCLVGRRLAERGVRFIELIHRGSGSNWDSHADMKDHEKTAAEADGPIAALLTDLKARGMLEETMVVCATEFGRTPRRDSKFGRHHHGNCFSIWVAGAGFRRGHVHGATDDIGFNVVDGAMDVFDLHATLLNQLGIDHKKLTYRHAGRDFRLTDVHGRVRQELLAT